MKRRILMSFAGVLTCAVSVAIFRLAAFGVDPFQTLMGGLDKVIPISFGTLYVIVNALLLLFSLIFDRHYIGLATFINLFLLGYVTEFSYQFFLTLIIGPCLFVRILLISIAILVLCIGSSLYITADLGVSTYDAIALILANKWKLAPFKYIRILTDTLCVLIGVILFFLGGGTTGALFHFIGTGTILTAFFMGPLITYFNHTIAIPLLKK